MSKIVQIKDAIKAKVEASHEAAVSALEAKTAEYKTDRENKESAANASIDAKVAAEAAAQQGRAEVEEANRTAKDAKLVELETLKISDNTLQSVKEVTDASAAYEAQYSASLGTLAAYQVTELNNYKSARGDYQNDFLGAFDAE